MILIAITGTNGSGKGTVVEYLVNEKGFTHFAARDFLTHEVKKRGLVVDRSSMRLVANELRAEHEPAYVVKQLFSQAEKDGCERAVIESVRNIGEAEFLKSEGALLIAVDADQYLRYARVEERRSATDQVDFETFVEHEVREMKPVGPHDMDLLGVMALSDITIMNDGSREELQRAIETAIQGV